MLKTDAAGERLKSRSAWWSRCYDLHNTKRLFDHTCGVGKRLPCERRLRRPYALEGTTMPQQSPRIGGNCDSATDHFCKTFLWVLARPKPTRLAFQSKTV